ncbi:DUF4060 family protein [Salmonella enterica subsp. enterica serovar Napoli]|uniref:DUF4060 family protein n=1 Tax=Salmonella enterica subsp. enterica serovar Napoli TaxID=1151001 RepID=A0A5J2KFT3_SALET|nr:hypothetical protein [Salmonella enterica subsp. enterica serovar Napoli]EAW0369172.1 DUF4060 family protein [Salmonella enterica]EBN0192342.1 DUF4060 family protein [Salmonella enterica subsp. enterica serovar Enteritidis]EDS6569752.1 DUF4060 family protein [Salmonella enterica subsp. enterica]EAX5132973.1 DUF4060 family protein [Salmonella enterica]
MISHHYGTQTVNRGAVMPGMLVKHREGTWTASANKRGRLYVATAMIGVRKLRNLPAQAN